MTVMLLYGTNREKGNIMLTKMKDRTGLAVVKVFNMITTVIAMLAVLAIWGLSLMLFWNLIVTQSFPGATIITWWQATITLFVLYFVREAVKSVASTELTFLKAKDE